MLHNLDFLNKGEPWLPDDSDTKKRFERYSQNKKIFEGKHAEIYEEQFKRIERVIGNFQDVVSYEVIINYQKLISLKIADLLFGEPPHINSTDNKETVELIIENNDLFNKLYENAIDVSRYGDGLLYIAQGEGFGEINVSNPCMWIPIVDKLNSKKIINHVLAWEYEETINKQKVGRLYLQIHDKGFYEERLYSTNKTQIGTLIGDLIESNMVKTGLSDFAVINTTNIVTSDKVTGYDDYSDLDSIISEILVRISQIARVLDKHAAPSVSGSSSALQQDPASGEWKLIMANYFPRDNADDPEVKYITWDGKLDASFKQIELLINQLYVISEMGSVLLGGEDKGGQLSGRALRMKMISPLAKVKRIAMRLTPVIKKAIKLLSELGGEGIVNLKDDNISITWQDGLPNDPVEEAEIINLRTGGTTMSQKRAIMQYDGMDEEEAEEELELIQNEEVANNPIKESPFSGDNRLEEDEDGQDNSSE